MVIVKYKKLHPDAKMFEQKTDGAVCADVYALEDTYITTGATKVVKTGIAVEIPKGYEGLVRPRSGFSSKGIDTALGTIDCDYRGDVGVIITNNSYNSISIKKHDRIGQFAIREVPIVTYIESEELTDTERGTNGFGSTGIK